MAQITAAEIAWRLSTSAGGVTAGNQATSTPATSLGRYISTTLWAGGTVNDLFDDVSGAENAAQTVDYRCVFIHNANTANVLQNAVAYMTAPVAGGADVAIGVDPTAASALAATGVQAVTIANETTAPAGVTFSTTAASIATGLALGNIGIGQVKAIWIRRTATNSAAQSGDGVTLNCTGDSGSL